MEDHDRLLVHLDADGAAIEGNLTIPKLAGGMIVFAHGSGSSRLSPRNQWVGRSLNGEGLGTLLLDLLTPEEDVIDQRTAQYRFDIDLLANRLVAATRWLVDSPQTKGLPIGYFGASTGAGAALIAAAREPDRVGAVVSRGGRPDLAGSWLGGVRAPTLLIVGGNDTQVIALNRAALGEIQVEKDLVIVPGATHLFEEPGALNQVAGLAGEWFRRHLKRAESTVAA